MEAMNAHNIIIDYRAGRVIAHLTQRQTALFRCLSLSRESAGRISCALSKTKPGKGGVTWDHQAFFLKRAMTNELMDMIAATCPDCSEELLLSLNTLNNLLGDMTQDDWLTIVTTLYMASAVVNA